jgi:hypothetical protein
MSWNVLVIIALIAFLCTPLERGSYRPSWRRAGAGTCREDTARHGLTATAPAHLNEASTTAVPPRFAAVDDPAATWDPSHGGGSPGPAPMPAAAKGGASHKNRLVL